MRGPQKVNDFLWCPAPKRCPEPTRRNFLIEKPVWGKDEILHSADAPFRMTEKKWQTLS